MTASRVEPGFDQDRAFADRDAAHGLAPDLSRVLVAGNSQINRIVVAKIVERSGLKPVSETPVSAVRVLPLLFPGLVILDGGPDNTDCDSVIAGVVALRRASGPSPRHVRSARPLLLRTHSCAASMSQQRKRCNAAGARRSGAHAKP